MQPDLPYLGMTYLFVNRRYFLIPINKHALGDYNYGIPH